jgi:amidophosphoribosyltransferase
VKEACGVFGVYAPGKGVANLTFDGLYALQHRGQESAGMAVSDGDAITVVKDMGLVTTVFDERKLSCLPGHLAIGHTRYSTTARIGVAQRPAGLPLGGPGRFRPRPQRQPDQHRRAGRRGRHVARVVASDSDLVAELLARLPRPRPAPPAEGRDLETALRAGAARRRGCLLLRPDRRHPLIGVRDPYGFRPLCLGRLGPADEPEGWVLASETPALDIVGATFVRELEPGELVVIDGGVRSERPSRGAGRSPRLCIFEFVYFARPDSRLYGARCTTARRRMGELLAAQAPVEADLVMGVPESGVPAAEGFARATGIPYGQGLVKNRYIGRTFIAPDPGGARRSVRRKLNPLRENIAGKRIVVVDDSIVRGTTQRAVVQDAARGRATEVHLRISSPP